MAIHVLFFGATADATGKRQSSLESRDNATVRAAIDNLISQFPSLASHRLLIAVNQQYSTGDEKLRDGDEIAVFTAVSGG